MKKRPVDDIDIYILNRLSRDANVTNLELASEIGLSQGPTLVRVQNLWKRGILTNYQAKINYSYFKFNLKYALIISIHPDGITKFISKIHKEREIIYCSELEKKNSAVDNTRFLVIFVTKSPENLEEFFVGIKKDMHVYDVDVAGVSKVVKDENLVLTNEDI
jgi:DNA-binding Lrp family transcriptional regulator